jgi:hypothetical protein
VCGEGEGISAPYCTVPRCTALSHTIYTPHLRLGGADDAFESDADELEFGPSDRSTVLPLSGSPLLALPSAASTRPRNCVQWAVGAVSVSPPTAFQPTASERRITFPLPAS